MANNQILIVTEAELRAHLQLDKQAIDLVENAFATLSSGGVVMPPIMSMEFAEINAEVDVKAAFIPGMPGFAIKVSPGFFNNPQIGLPSLNGLMMLFSAETGLVRAVLLDNGYLTDVRTAAAGGVAARHLAPKNVKTAGVVGAGVQARLQIAAAYEERKFEKVLVWARNFDRAQECAADIERDIGIAATAVDDIEAVVRKSQLVVTTTPSREPLIKSDWLHPQLHITAMGSDQEGKGELDPNILTAADLYVCDRLSQCEKLGELRSAIEHGSWTKNHNAIELGGIVANNVVGRKSDDQVTVCDLTGTGVQDTAIANLAFDLAQKFDLGTKITT